MKGKLTILRGYSKKKWTHTHEADMLVDQHG